MLPTFATMSLGVAQRATISKQWFLEKSPTRVKQLTHRRTMEGVQKMDGAQTMVAAQPMTLRISWCRPTVTTTTSITCMPTGAREKHARTERRGLMSWCASADDSLRTAIATKIRLLLRVLKRLQRLMSRDIAALHYDRRCYDLLCDDRGTRDHKSYYSRYDC